MSSYLSIQNEMPNIHTYRLRRETLKYVFLVGRIGYYTIKTLG